MRRTNSLVVLAAALACASLPTMAQSYLDGYRVRRDGTIADPPPRAFDGNTNTYQGDPQRPDPSTRDPGTRDPYRPQEQRINPGRHDEPLGR
jgi:hypothetical protein